MVLSNVTKKLPLHRPSPRCGQCQNFMLDSSQCDGHTSRYPIEAPRFLQRNTGNGHRTEEETIVLDHHGEEESREKRHTHKWKPPSQDHEWRKAMFFLSRGPSSTLEFLNENTKALLFAYKSQAIDGPCTPLHLSMCPSDPNFMAMQQAWLALGDMPKEQARQEFINLLTTLLPDWRDWFDTHADLGIFDGDGGEVGRIMKRFYSKGISFMAKI